MTKPRSSLRGTDGFTMAAVMMGMLVLMSLSVATFAAANGDIRLGQRSLDEKKAYSAAEAGIAYYLQKLAQDNDYWTKCLSDPELPHPNPVNDVWNRVGTEPDPRRFRKLPTSPEQEYAIELLPRAGRAKCVPGDNESMIDPAQGTLRIRSTGRSRGVHRSVVSTLRRNGFLDFIYFTDRETSDPAQQSINQGFANIDGTDRNWKDIPIKRLSAADARLPANVAANNFDSIAAWADQPTTCGQWWRSANPTQQGRVNQGRYGADGRGSAFFDPDNGSPYANDWNLTSAARLRNGTSSNIACTLIQFRGPDQVDGPFHSNDHICVTNNPSFGRTGKSDRIEFFGFHPSCENSATFRSTPKTGANLVTLGVPKSNTQLEATAFPQYRFNGKTEITLQGGQMLVKRANGSTSTLGMPANGLVYVGNDDALPCQKFNLERPYPTAGEDQGCGDALVSGTYSESLTIATERDVLVTGDIKATTGSDSLLGLIGLNYVRIKHAVQVTGALSCTAASANTPGAPQNRTVEAAILSLNHVFTVDNFQCGSFLGNLTVKGAIAQLYRGPVGTGSGATGYNKIYQYDDRLRFRSPPYFITPVESAWRALRTTEQSPATRPAV